MFRHSILLLFSCSFMSQNLCAQIITFNFNGSDGNELSFGVDGQPANGSASDMSRGNGVNASLASGAFSASSWSRDGLDVDDYFTFSLTPDPGFELSISGLQLDERRSATGIHDWSLRSSLDTFATDIGTVFSLPDNTSYRRDQSIDLSGGLFDDLTHTIEFRFYGYNAESSLGTWRLDNVDLFGVITPVPEVSGSTWIALSLFGFYYWNAKKRRDEKDPSHRLSRDGVSNEEVKLIS